MGHNVDKAELSTTPSDLAVLQEKGFVLEKIIGEGSYAKVNVVNGTRLYRKSR